MPPRRRQVLEGLGPKVRGDSSGPASYSGKETEPAFFLFSPFSSAKGGPAAGKEKERKSPKAGGTVQNALISPVALLDVVNMSGRLLKPVRPNDASLHPRPRTPRKTEAAAGLTMMIVLNLAPFFFLSFFSRRGDVAVNETKLILPASLLARVAGGLASSRATRGEGSEENRPRRRRRAVHGGLGEQGEGREEIWR